MNRAEINYMALALCVLSEDFVPPEKAFEYLERDEYLPLDEIEMRMYLTDEDSEDMAHLAEKLGYKKTGELYGLRFNQVYGRVRNLELKLKRRGIAL